MRRIYLTTDNHAHTEMYSDLIPKNKPKTSPVFRVDQDYVRNFAPQLGRRRLNGTKEHSKCIALSRYITYAYTHFCTVTTTVRV